MRAASALFLAWTLLGLAAPARAGVQYYVDPVGGADAPTGGSEQTPWKTTSYAFGRIALLPPASQAGLVLNLRASALYPPVVLPATLHGTPADPIVIQPYDGDRVVFDGGEPRFRQPGAWEPVPGQVDEWRTKDTFTLPAGQRVAWGQMMDTRLRLITYLAIEDMRAVNESYRGELGNRVPLSDPRPAPGPVVGDEAHKIPYTYLGPGVYYSFENAEKTAGRVHLRLSPTHIRAVGIEDYAGGGDPNLMNLSIARETSITGRIDAQNVVLRNLVFQNGGRTTLLVDANARNVTFDHCEVYGAQYGVRIGPAASELKFHHCTFDGGLAPWTSRSDVKNEYYFQGPPDCPRDTNGLCINMGGAKTHDILVIHQASRSEYVNCTFRRGHDALMLSGDDVEVRDSLFEDLNDEVLQFGNDGANVVSNVRVHGNVIRQTLSPVSFVLNPTVGPIYFYRNVIDQRVPTRGHRILPPDAPAPWVWRYGNDFKDTPTLPFHCYQNTFLASHDLDKGSYANHLFYTDPPVGPTYRNNLHLMLNLDRPLSRVPSAGSGAVSDGNVWYRFHPNPEPLFRHPMFVSAVGRYFTFPELWSDFPSWEVHSQYADPQLADFTDEYFEFAGFYPDTDFRLSFDSPARAAGVVLPSTLPDDFTSTGAPDVGARPVDAPVMAVGVDGATLFPAADAPVALAGSDQVVPDADGDGFERVRLDASQSHGPYGLDGYVWTIGGKAVVKSDVPNAALNLPEGDHHVRLLVFDKTGGIDSDALRVRVAPRAPGENHLDAPGFEETASAWRIGPGAVVTTVGGEVHSGARAIRLPNSGLAKRFSQRVPAGIGLFTVSGWMRTQSLAGAPAVLTVLVLDGDGAVLDSRTIAHKQSSSPYSYHEVVIDVPKGAAFLEVMGSVSGGGSGAAFFDDLRIRDRNLLQNGRFEVRSASGHVREAPGWEFGRGGLIVEDAPNVRSGRYALAFAPYNGYHLTRQTIVHETGRTYRVSGWVKTLDLATAPTFSVRFLGASGQNLGLRQVAAVTSEGEYRYVSRDLPAGDIPAATAMLRVELLLDQVATGTAFFEDLRVEPLP